MAVSNEQFLFSCIDNWEGGTVKWQAVADACGIPTKGAAAIKFRRLKEKFGNPSDEVKSPGAEGGTESPAKGKKKATPKKAPSKKRKVEETKEAEATETPVKDEEADDGLSQYIDVSRADS